MTSQDVFCSRRTHKNWDVIFAAEGRIRKWNAIFAAEGRIRKWDAMFTNYIIWDAILIHHIYIGF